MTNRINRQSEAFQTALDYCKIFGLDWRRHIEPKIKDKHVVGYYVIDETRSTTVATVEI